MNPSCCWCAEVKVWCQNVAQTAAAQNRIQKIWCLETHHGMHGIIRNLTIVLNGLWKIILLNAKWKARQCTIPRYVKLSWLEQKGPCKKKKLGKKKVNVLCCTVSVWDRLRRKWCWGETEKGQEQGTLLLHHWIHQNSDLWNPTDGSWWCSCNTFQTMQSTRFFFSSFFFFFGSRVRARQRCGEWTYMCDNPSWFQSFNYRVKVPSWLECLGQNCGVLHREESWHSWVIQQQIQLHRRNVYLCHGN